MRKDCLIFGLCVGLAAGPALAQDGPIDFPLAEVLALAGYAHVGREAFAEHLAAALPGLVMLPAPRMPTDADAYSWSVVGHFGGPGASPVPGAIVACSRYGVVTRDLFVEHGFSQPETFELMTLLAPQSDDLDVWPEGAVARLHCDFIWDDAQTVRIMPEAIVREVFQAQFETLEMRRDGASDPQLLGEGGFDLLGTSGAGDSVIWVESGEAILTNGHQQVQLRAFLMGGAV